MSQQDSQNNFVNLQLDQELVSDLVVYKNVNQEVIVTTFDKVRLSLIEHQKMMNAKRDWLTPFGICSSILATIITADFKNFLNLSPDMWKALFILVLIASFIWLIYSVYNLIKFRNRGDTEDFIKAIRGQAKV